MTDKKKISRRQLLKTGCVAAASVTAPVIIRSSVLGDANTPPPSERVTLGHIGVGTRGRSLFAASQAGQGIQSLAVADCFQSRRDRFAAERNTEYGSTVCTAYADYRELLARDDIDGVVISTPDHWHVPIAVHAARAGKDMYVEKPLGLAMAWSLIHWPSKSNSRRSSPCCTGSSPARRN